MTRGRSPTFDRSRTSRGRSRVPPRGALTARARFGEKSAVPRFFNARDLHVDAWRSSDGSHRGIFLEIDSEASDESRESQRVERESGGRCASPGTKIAAARCARYSFVPFPRRVSPSKRRTRALTHARLVGPTVAAELPRPSHGASTFRNSPPRARRAIPRASVAARRR